MVPASAPPARAPEGAIDPRWTDGGKAPIIDHPFFASIDFERLVARSLEPPHVPSIASEVDTSHFEDIDDSATHFSDEPPYADGPGTWDYFF